MAKVRALGVWYNSKMKKIYIYSALVGLVSVVLLLAISLLIDDLDYPFLGSFFLDVVEPFVADDGASIAFDAGELILTPINYILFDIVLGTFLLVIFLRGKLTSVFKKIHLIALANLFAFYAGFVLIGAALMLVLGGAWFNFSGF